MLSVTKRFLNRLVRGQEGAAFTEYGLLLLLVVLAIAVTGTTLGADIILFLNEVGDSFATATAPAIP